MLWKPKVVMKKLRIFLVEDPKEFRIKEFSKLLVTFVIILEVKKK